MEGRWRLKKRPRWLSFPTRRLSRQETLWHRALASQLQRNIHFSIKYIDRLRDASEISARRLEVADFYLNVARVPRERQISHFRPLCYKRRGRLEPLGSVAWQQVIPLY